MALGIYGDLDLYAGGRYRFERHRPPGDPHQCQLHRILTLNDGKGEPRAGRRQPASAAKYDAVLILLLAGVFLASSYRGTFPALEQARARIELFSKPNQQVAGVIKSQLGR